MKPHRFLSVVSSICSAVLLASCVAPAPGSDAQPARAPVPREVAPMTAAPAPAAPAAQAPAAAAPALPPAPFPEVVARAGERLLLNAQAVVGSGPRELVIDPLIDASTGQQTHGTVQMGEQLSGLIRSKVPGWNVKALSRGSLANGPLLLIGTLTAINTAGDVKESNADAFRICLVLIDLRTGKLVANRVDRATLASVNAEPTALYRDSPTWAHDLMTMACIKSCQGSSPGDAIDPLYLRRLPVAALINEAANAFAGNRPVEAYRLYREALPIAGAGDLRVLNGLYLTSWQTGKRQEAGETFGKIVGIGLETRRLPIKMFFNPGQATLLRSADLQAQYAVWLREVATQVGTRRACIRVVGHTSRTGSAAANDRLSQRRAAAIKRSLEQQDRRLPPRVAAEGVGSREIIVGLGTDDLRDALDRRVEFRAVDCA